MKVTRLPKLKTIHGRCRMRGLVNPSDSMGFVMGIIDFPPGSVSPMINGNPLSCVYFCCSQSSLVCYSGHNYYLRHSQAIMPNNRYSFSFANNRRHKSRLVYFGPSRSAEHWQTWGNRWEEDILPHWPTETCELRPSELYQSDETANLNAQPGLHFPGARWGRSITNGKSGIIHPDFTAGLSILHQWGSQVPWHYHPDGQKEVYYIPFGRVQMVIGEEVQEVTGPAVIHIPGDQWHQITNIGDSVVSMIYCYEGAVSAPHWREELGLEGAKLPVAGENGVPALPKGAFPQCTAKSADEWFAHVASLRNH